MRRLFRLNKELWTLSVIYLLMIIMSTVNIFTSKDPINTFSTTMSGILYGCAIMLTIQNISLEKGKFTKMNYSPIYDCFMTIFACNNPLMFGTANDFLDKDLLLYPPLKKSLYTLKGVYDNKIAHIACLSWNERKNIVRVIDIIDLKDITDSEEPKRYYLRLTYDLKITDKVTIIPRQVVAYDSNYCGMVFAFDKQIFKISKKDYRNDPATLSECEATCDRIKWKFRFEDFEEYFREFLETAHISNEEVDSTKVPELRQIRKDIEIVIDGDDYLEIFKNNKYYLK